VNSRADRSPNLLFSSFFLDLKNVEKSGWFLSASVHLADFLLVTSSKVQALFFLSHDYCKSNIYSTAFLKSSVKSATSVNVVVYP
jgi:hypothetical protein